MLMALRCIALCGVAWHGSVVWYGVAWWDIAWWDMVWNGIE